MTVRALITIQEVDDGPIMTMVEVDQAGGTANERKVGGLIDKVIGAGLSAIAAHFQKTQNAQSYMGSAKGLDEAIEAAIKASLGNG